MPPGAGNTLCTTPGTLCTTPHTLFSHPCRPGVAGPIHRAKRALQTSTFPLSPEGGHMREREGNTKAATDSRLGARLSAALPHAHSFSHRGQGEPYDTESTSRHHGWYALTPFPKPPSKPPGTLVEALLIRVPPQLLRRLGTTSSGARGDRSGCTPRQHMAKGTLGMMQTRTGPFWVPSPVRPPAPLKK